jgi:NAD(P)H-dependent flavin oxidoreductase YrpB (nitropropane dioxygenase family)
MRGQRRFSQAISEGDGISLLADVSDADAARRAEAGGAEGLVARGDAVGLRGATELPILCYSGPDEDADAYVIRVEGHEAEDGWLEGLYASGVESGFDCVVAVRDEDELQLALERLDPEIVLLSARGAGDGLEHILGLLPDVPAGKLAIAELGEPGRDEVEELERAGVDAVIVRSADVDLLIGER